MESVDPTPTPADFPSTPTEIPSTPPLTPQLEDAPKSCSLPGKPEEEEQVAAKVQVKEEEGASETASSIINSATIAEAATHIIDFLQHATPETLGGVMLGSTVVLYVVFGSFGLLIIGAIGGVVLHASLENIRAAGKQEHRVNILDWLDKRRLDVKGGGALAFSSLESENGIEKSFSGHKRSAKSQRVTDFSSLPPETGAAFTELADAVARDYVRWWYSPILPADESFPATCRQTIIQTLYNMHSHLSQKCAKDTFLLFLVSTSNTFIVFFRELAQTAQTSIGTYVEEYPSSALSQLVDRREQKRKLKMAADDIVTTFVPADVTSCNPMKTFLTEIIAGVVLEKLVDKFSSAEWINSTIVYLLEKETQPEILQKIDIGEATLAVNDRHVSAAVEEQKAKRISRAEEEMERAMREAQELNAMIAEEEAKRVSGDFGPGRDANGNTSGGGGLNGSSNSLNSDNASIRSSSENGNSRPPTIVEGSISPSAEPGTFTSFDQLLSPSPTPSSPVTPLDPLYRAHVTVSDLTPPSETKVFDPFSGGAFTASADKPLRSKPTSAVYLIQIEPGVSTVPGWILTRKYTDFETLHEVLRRISNISGLESFTHSHSELPAWRGCTKEALRNQLERYINDALKEKILAESEGMKRFLEKDSEANNGNKAHSPVGAFGGLGKNWPNPQAFAKMGGGMLDALTKAPQGAAEGGKSLFGGVFMKRGLNGDNRRQTLDISSLRQLGRSDSSLSLRAENEPPVKPEEEEPVVKLNNRQSFPVRRSSLVGMGRVQKTEKDGYIQLEIPSADGDGPGFVSLPPPPSDMPDDYDSDAAPVRTRSGSAAPSLLRPEPETTTFRTRAASAAAAFLVPSQAPPLSPVPPSPPIISTTPPPLDNPAPPTPPAPAPPSAPATSLKPKSTSKPLTESETIFAVEIFFAIISELYTLSSAWLFRRSLLNVAKNILLRPGNATLESIRALIQETVIDANIADAAIAVHVKKITKNGFPTKEERAAWPPVVEMSDDEKSELREKARKLVGERGMPEALKGLMGAGASRECWGVVFDALQERGVARGVVTGLMIEGIRGVCH